MNNDFQSSRSGYRAKRRKTNLVLNSLIILVLALIIIVAYNVFASGDDENASSSKATPKTEQKAAVDKDKNEQSTEAEKSDGSSQDTAKQKDEDSDESDSKAAHDDQEETDPEEADAEQATVMEGGSSPNVAKTIVNPAWKPVGTSQTGEHTAVYDQSSVDWQEMLKAVTYATGIDQSNMTVYWLGRDKSTNNGSFATVASKDKTQKYNVYLEWVDGEGWKPTKMEELSEIQ
ncbi:YrrS family protein [Neobacillus muris]|uniref:YrrS family protein n=1 Tax=Neobacillus muris TaxID=2941334 RepID=UPI00203F6F9E|nr:DUF1510 family protein [Neobacillus muris]